MRYFITTLIVLAVIILALVLRPKQAVGPEPATVASTASSTSPGVAVFTPIANSVVNSPLEISGKALGSWFFEASFPVKLLDADGNVLAAGQARALSDWQTADYASFQCLLNFTASGTIGSLEFSRDNPSGLPQNSESFFVPVRFH